MRKHRIVIALAALALAGCVSRTPLELPPEHPAQPKAPEGFVTAPAAFDDYKSVDDFSARAAADARAPAESHMQHQGMQHGSMPMQNRGGTR